MKKLVMSVLLLGQFGCASIGTIGMPFCTKGTGIVYDNHSMMIDQIVPGSPAMTANVPIFTKLIKHDGGHIIIEHEDGRTEEFFLQLVCLESVNPPKTEWK